MYVLFFKQPADNSCLSLSCCRPLMSVETTYEVTLHFFQLLHFLCLREIFALFVFRFSLQLLHALFVVELFCHILSAVCIKLLKIGNTLTKFF